LMLGIAWGQVPTQRFEPELPRSALADPALDERCVARVMTDAKGFVYRVQVDGCTAPYVAATEDALWRWVIPGGTAFAIEVRFLTRPTEEGGTGNAQVIVGEPVASDPLPPTDPPTVPISTLTIVKRKEPDVSATMLSLSQEQGIVEVFCLAVIVVNAKGKVSEIAVASCHPDLVDPIASALAKWRFGTWDGARRTTIVMPVRSYTESRGM
jgi:hypothetical protein